MVPKRAMLGIPIEMFYTSLADLPKGLYPTAFQLEEGYPWATQKLFWEWWVYLKQAGLFQT